MSGSQSTELDRYYTDWRGVQVHVIRWDRVDRQVIFTREGYPHECMQPLERFKEKFKRVDV
ncbi:DUF4222 domain-containing protein [Serratia sp. TSA_130.2]|uniref:DUF4222 domain-containing protein n=1 Tax=unclassified Serratia (in: enterobacteria) TaxID=2647522 RepID=UPI0040467927